MTGPDKQPRRPPRWVYWLSGALVACGGAFIANWLSAELPLEARGPFWLAGTAVIFVGLWILSKGTGAQRGDEGDEGDEGDGRG